MPFFDVFLPNKKINLFATVDAFTGDFFCTKADQCDAQSFQGFLERLLDRYSQKHLVLVLDNARIHHAKIIRPFLKEQANHLTFLFLPSYSPQLNLVERMWKWLKESVIANRFYQTQAEICDAIDDFVQYVQEISEKVLQRINEIYRVEN